MVWTEGIHHTVYPLSCKGVGTGGVASCHPGSADPWKVWPSLDP